MGFFWIALQAIVAVFLVLWSHLVRFVFLVLQWFPPRLSSPELPVSAPLHQNVCVPRYKLGCITQGIAFKFRLSRGPPKRPTIHRIALATDVGDIVDLRSPPPTVTPTSDIHYKPPIPVVPLLHLPSPLDMFVCSINPVSPVISSPRLSSTLTIQIVTPEHCIFFGGDVVIPEFNTAAFAQGFRKGLIFEDISQLRRISIESYDHGTPINKCVEKHALTDFHPLSPDLTPDPFDVGSVYENLSGGFNSKDISTCGRVSNAKKSDESTGGVNIADSDPTALTGHNRESCVQSKVRRILSRGGAFFADSVAFIFSFNGGGPYRKTEDLTFPPTRLSFSALPIRFLLPDLISHCTYPLRLNPHCCHVARASEQWLLAGANHSEAKAKAFMGLRAGELTAACYPDTDAFHLRVCADFMNYLFNLDDWLDEFDVIDTNGMADCCISALRNPHTFKTDKAAGKMSKSFFSRFVKDAGPGCTERFILTMDLFFKAVAQQSADRAQRLIPDLESYIPIRRNTSGCKPCFALIEYAASIDLPDHVVHHPIIRSLEEATNDLVTWSNDIFSYNVERSRNDTHNMIPITMFHQNLTLQEAVDFVGTLCKASIERFHADRVTLPSWGPDIDHDVAAYVEGLQNWIVGSLHWSFDSERYFGKLGAEIKRHRIVEILSSTASSTGIT